MTNAFTRQALFASTAIVCMAVASPARAQTKAFDIPAQSAGSGIAALGRQAGVQIAASRKITQGKRTNSVRGDMSVEQALQRLLAGTGLVARSTGSQTWTIVVAPEAARPQPGARPAASSGEDDAGSATAENDESAEIVVTGTNIRGVAPSGSPLIQITRDDIDRSGAATTSQLMRKLPQNFSGIDGAATLGRTTPGNPNPGQGTSVDLRGLGSQATLVLLNGHRLAPTGGNGEYADISLIPLSAVARVDILGDGASAIYGSDAIGGVVNFVLRDNFNGMESNLRVGLPTRTGGSNEITASQLLGLANDRGNLTLSYEFNRQTALEASDRSFIPNQPFPVDILPLQRRHSVFVSGHHDLGSSTAVYLDALYSNRVFAQRAFDPSSNVLTADSGKVQTLNISPSVRHQFGGAWEGQIYGNYSKSIENRTSLFNIPPALELRNQSEFSSIGASGNGPLFALPGGDVKASLGGEYRRENFHPFDEGPDAEYHRSVTSIYGELYVPLISSANRSQLLESLTASIAARWDRYSDVGSAVTPKVGIAYEPTRSVRLRASYSESFRAPLVRLLSPQHFYLTLPFPNSNDPDGQTVSLVQTLNANPNLGPERSTAFSAGLDIRPVGTDIKMSATYYRVNYRDQVAGPPITGGLFNFFNEIDALRSFVNLNPSSDEVARIFRDNSVLDIAGGGPTAVEAIIDVAYQNIAETKISGVEAEISGSFASGPGKFEAFLSANYIANISVKASSQSQTVNLLGITYRPPKFRVRGGLSYEVGPISVSGVLNFVDDYRNTLSSVDKRVGSWATADLQMRYLAGPVRVTLDVENITDANPPFLKVDDASFFNLGYDSANASARGRVVSLAVRFSY